MQKMGAGPTDKMQEQRLLAELGLAERRNDLAAIRDLQAQVAEIQAVNAAHDQGNVSQSAMAQMLARVNERSKKTVQESHKRAFKAETERKRMMLGDFKSRMSLSVTWSRPCHVSSSFKTWLTDSLVYRLNTPSPGGSPAPGIENGASIPPVQVADNTDAKIIETKSGEIAVDLDLGDF